VLIQGTKRASRYRTVPLVTREQVSLTRYALEHAEGVDGALFRPWGNIRHDIAAACERLKIPHCSPNDLRRTCSTWLRQRGAPLELISLVMGHVDTRMFERVYGRLPTSDLAKRLAASLGAAACSDFVAGSAEKAAFTGFIGQDANPEVGKIAGSVVPRDGIEPSTRGFSVLCSTN
jgi:hypothetical protein